MLQKIWSRRVQRGRYFDADHCRIELGFSRMNSGRFWKTVVKPLGLLENIHYATLTRPGDRIRVLSRPGFRRLKAEVEARNMIVWVRVRSAAQIQAEREEAAAVYAAGEYDEFNYGDDPREVIEAWPCPFGD